MTKSDIFGFQWIREPKLGRKLTIAKHDRWEKFTIKRAFGIVVIGFGRYTAGWDA